MMTQLEKNALILLGRGIYMPPKKMALRVVVEWDGGYSNSPPVESADTYLATLEGMVAKGWLKVVQQSAETRRAQWLERGWLVPEEYRFADKGEFDFTRKGFALYGGVGQDDCLICRDEVNRTLSCVRLSAALCEEWLADERDPLRGSLTSYISGLVAITAIDKPEPVGKWFSREQERHRSGWRVTVHYRPVRRRRVRFPEYAVDAWLEPTANVRISGTVQGLRFRFYESVYSLGSDYFYTPSLRISIGARVPGEEIRTIFEGKEVVAGHWGAGYAESDFTWEAPDRLKPMTPDEAIVLLRQGIEAWRAADDTPVRTAHGPSQAKGKKRPVP